MKERSSLLKNTWGCLVLTLLVGLSYLPALRSGFVWDDDSYVTANPALTQPDGLRRIWLEPGATPQYYPVVFSSFRIERSLWQLSPAGYHGVNVALHAVNAHLLWFLLTLIGFPVAWLASAVFALHPLQVESVAWIAERKNVLSGCFYLLAAIAYFPVLKAATDVKRADQSPERSLLPYWVMAFCLYIAALLSKSVTATLPITLLVLTWWRRGFLTPKDFAMLLPFFATGTAAGLFTAWMEKTHVGALGADWSFSFVDRCVIAGKNILFYLQKTVWPSPLSFVYPRWQPRLYPWWHAAAPCAAVVLVVLLWRFRSRIGRGPLAATLFFLATLAPAIGFVDFYPMRYSFVADHFFYLAIIGPILCVVGCMAAMARPYFERGGEPDGRSIRLVAGTSAGGLLILLAVLTWQRSAVFRDEETLWRDTLAKNPAATIARVNLGILLAKRGVYPEARELFEAALAAEPEAADILTNLGNVYDSLGRTADAETCYRSALRGDPGFVAARIGLGSLLQSRGDFRDAVRQFAEALKLTPDNSGIRDRLADARYNLGKALDERGDLAEAVVLYREALADKPAFAEAHNNLGVDLALAGQRQEAALHFREALRLRPEYPEAAANLERMKNGLK